MQKTTFHRGFNEIVSCETLASSEQSETATDFFFVPHSCEKHTHWAKTQACLKEKKSENVFIFGICMLSNSHFNQANSCACHKTEKKLSKLRKHI